MVTREQLLAIGFSAHAIAHQLRTGRLHAVHRGVYAVGRRELSRRGEFMAAVLRCGPTAALMGDSAAVLWGIRPDRPAQPIEVSVGRCDRRVPGLVVRRQRYRRTARRYGIAVTSLVCTFVDLSMRLPEDELEAALGAADIAGLIDPSGCAKRSNESPCGPAWRGCVRRSIAGRSGSHGRYSNGAS